ncbi:MAG: MFS transporter [Myxococcales bacterium]|nr:MFS transporter [Myxococcales bacterium]
MPNSNGASPASDSAGAPAEGRVRTFEALRDRNYRHFFGTLLANFTAVNMQIFVRGWIVYELTGSYESLGVMFLVNGLAGFALAPFAGVIADRVRQRKRLVIVCQYVAAAVAFGVASLIWMGQLRFEHLIAAAVVQGAARTIKMPSRQALTAEVVGMGRLMNAIALNTSAMNFARLVMPGIAGFMVAAFGGGDGEIGPAAYVYIAMAVLYFYAGVGLIFVHVPDREPGSSRRGTALSELIDGFRYVWTTSPMRMLAVVNFFMVFFGFTYVMLLPGFAKQVLDAGPAQLGLLTTVSGIGSLTGSLLVASMRSQRRGLLLLCSGLVLSVGLMGFAASTAIAVSFALIIVVGLGQAGRMSLSNVLMQAYVDDDYRGRVSSIYNLEMSLANAALYPIGRLADHPAVGPQLALGGAGALLGALSLGLLLFAHSYRRLD